MSVVVPKNFFCGVIVLEELAICVGLIVMMMLKRVFKRDILRVKEGSKTMDVVTNCKKIKGELP